MFANCQIRDFFAIHLQLPNQRLFYFIIQIAGFSLVFGGGIEYKISNLVILIYLFSYCNHVVCVAVVRFNFRYQTYFFLLQNLSRSFQAADIFLHSTESSQNLSVCRRIPTFTESFQILPWTADIFLLFTESFQILPGCRRISSFYRIFLYLSRLCSITKDFKKIFRTF